MMFKKNRIFKYIVLLSIVLLLLHIIFLKKQPNKKENNLNTIIQINERNSLIKSISCDLSSEMTNSYFFYSKPNKVILNTYLFKREESKIASNGEVYWFWIKKFDPKSVYYCRPDKIDETRVIDPLKPHLIKSLICIDEIPLDSNVKFDNKIEVSFKDGQHDRLIIIDDGKIQEQHWNQNNAPILSIYVLEHAEVPTSIKVVWHKENYSAKIRINNIKINVKEEESFDAPNFKKINLEEY